MNLLDSNAQTLRLARAAGRRVVVIGGGTGLSTLLLGLKEYTDNITAVVTVTDDGGGSGVLRREFGIPPPGDLRNCILALANTSDTMEKLLSYRFSEGSLSGQSFGNLFLLALHEITGSFDLAVGSMSQILAITGQVLPVTQEQVSLRAVFEDGSAVTGETAITGAKKRMDLSIDHIELVPATAAPLPEVMTAIESAEVIILGPGSLYTSIIPNLLVNGISVALFRSRALRLFVLNIMTQEGETERYSAAQHVESLLQHAGGQIIDACVYNTRIAQRRLLARYALEGSEPLIPDEANFQRLGIRLLGYDMLSRSGMLARHDPLRLAYGLMDASRKLRPRTGELGEYDALLLDDTEGEALVIKE